MTTQDALTNRVQAMMFLATDLCMHKQYYGKVEKANIKTILQKYLSHSEVCAVTFMYNKELPISDTFEQIPSVMDILKERK